MARKPIKTDFNAMISYRPGNLLGLAMTGLAETHQLSRGEIARRLACMALAGFSIQEFDVLGRAAGAIDQLPGVFGIRDPFPAICRALGPQCADRPRAERLRIINRFTIKTLELLEETCRPEWTTAQSAPSSIEQIVALIDPEPEQ